MPRRNDQRHVYARLDRFAISDYFNTTAFCAPPVVGVVNGLGGATGYGNVGMNPVLGLGQFDWDISLQKHTVVGGLLEDADLEFRTDFFNAFNHPQFNNPASNFGSASAFGVITTTSVGPPYHSVCAKVCLLI